MKGNDMCQNEQAISADKTIWPMRNGSAEITHYPVFPVVDLYINDIRGNGVIPGYTEPLDGVWLTKSVPVKCMKKYNVSGLGIPACEREKLVKQVSSRYCTNRKMIKKRVSHNKHTRNRTTTLIKLKHQNK